MLAEPPFLAENELEFVVGTGKGTSMNCPLIPRGSSRGYKAYSTRNALGLERGAWVRLPPSPPENEFCYSKMQARFFFLYLLKLETCFWKVRGKGGVFPNEKRKAKHFDSL